MADLQTTSAPAGTPDLQPKLHDLCLDGSEKGQVEGSGLVGVQHLGTVGRTDTRIAIYCAK
jgi:hypothetical protein